MAQNTKFINVILAGGKGSRLWPLSLPEKPKQFLKLNGQNYSLFQQSFLRNYGIDTYLTVVSVNENNLAIAVQQLQEIDAKNFIFVTENEHFDTFLSIAATCKVLNDYIKNKDKDNDIIAFFTPSDQVLDGSCKFALPLSKVNSSHFHLFAIKPSYPATGYGYIELAENALNVQEGAWHSVKSFHEKPSKGRAVELIATQNFFWNSGIFAFYTDVLLNFCKSRLSDPLKDPFKLVEISQRSDKVYAVQVNHSAKAAGAWPNFRSFDYEVLERSKNIIATVLNVNWTDLGTFQNLYMVAPKDENGSYIEGKVHAENVKNCYIVNLTDKQITVENIKNKVVVHSNMFHLEEDLFVEA